ncbi:protein-export membrane protein SecD [Thermodesulfatator indicus DSM 15286]|uniref:Multifunctional fusion protein n=1 Tax=Thermodesulfatator indicus (strain DSM 15286 / JCM 11887 / CIR29812) TaxID=667014 RepID=F8A904_THEID|nr:protein translocase subunit SecDF [Thermodesulfatator indicus]AEH44054.1 protein-export membrane protein SecD [Thermodesulfatator indicus DSM 15286]
MSRTLKLKIALVVVLTIISVLLVLPSFCPNLPSWYYKYIYKHRLKLGLDLQGGMHLVLKVDIDKAIQNALNASVKDLQQTLARKGIRVTFAERKNPKEAVLVFPNKEALEKAKEIITKDFPSLSIVREQEGKFPRLVVTLSEKQVAFIKEHAVDQSLEIIRNRIDQFGVTEPVIVKEGEDKIVVQLPGVKNPERALKLIGQTAQLEFRLVDDEAMSRIDVAALIDKAIKEGRLKPNASREEINRVLRPYIPPDTEVFFLVEKDPRTGRVIKQPLLLKKQVLLTGDMVKDARVRIGGPYNEPYVALEFTDRGARIFERVTGENVGKRLAIVLDGVVRSAPVIREKISGGQAQITGAFTYEEAADLAIVLRAGALPAPVKVIQNITVGPSLGHDSIKKGLTSGLIGAALVILFMIVYYRFAGLVADVAILLNVLMLLAALSLLQATLTLPGIAGIILLVGMGVDSNVLIFERMREELLLGRSPRSAIFAGYDRAFWTIIDANVTTLITALALFLFGTGPIKGFAVTLSTGIIINLFTSIFATRTFYELLIAKGKIPKINFMTVIKETSFDFMGFRKYAAIFSGALVLLGIIGSIQIYRGAANLGVDFSGGVLAYYRAEKPFKLDKIRKALKDAGITGFSLQDVKNENMLLVKLRKKTETVGDLEAQVRKVLQEKFPTLKFKLEGKEEIGAAVSKELKHKAILAIVISFAGLLIYLAFRFNLNFGLAAAAATMHDVLAVTGLFYLFNREISLLFVTSLLTLAGYSLNDTVVVFDRIRENIKKYHGKLSFVEIINKSINEMLARTIITAGTTLIVVLAILFFGGVVLRDFALALAIGIVVGTYSSIFVASPIVYWLQKGKTPEIKS